MTYVYKKKYKMVIKYLIFEQRYQINSEIYNLKVLKYEIFLLYSNIKNFKKLRKLSQRGLKIMNS